MSSADLANKRLNAVMAGMSGSAAVADGSAVDLLKYARAALRHKQLMATITGLVALTALALALALPRYYEFVTRLLVDPRGIQALDRDVTPRTNTTDQSVSVVESEMRVLGSDVVLMRTIKKLGLDADPEFIGTQRNLFSFVGDFMDGTRDLVRAIMRTPASPANNEIAALRYMQRAIRLRREPQSFILDLSVTTRDGEKSAMIANEIATQYLGSKFDAQSGVTGRASDTMTGRLDDLRARLEKADEAVERYKRDNGIIGASGRLVNEQQLSELNSQLVAARADTSRANVRLEQLRAVRQTGAEPDSTNEALLSETIRNLRSQYASIRRREAAQSATLMPNHPLVKQVRQELADTRRLISEEVGRISEAARLDLERARNNEQKLERDLTGLKSIANVTNEKLVRLREYEREAEVSRSVYTSFLGRSRELSEQKRVDTSLAVVLSPAVPPRFANGLALPLVLGAGTLLGLGLGVGGALLRDRRDPVIRDPAQIKEAGGTRTPFIVPPLDVLPGRPGMFGGRKTRALDASDPLPSFVLTRPDAPASLAAGQLAAEIAANRDPQATALVLVTAAAPMEGKSTIALNVALAASRRGDRVLLIDGDAEAHILTNMVQAERLPGLKDILAGARNPAAAILRVPGVGVDVLPIGDLTARPVGRVARNVEKAVQALAAPYDLVVVDGGLLPYGYLCSAWARLSVETLLVVREGTTQKHAVNAALAAIDRRQLAQIRPVMVSGV